MAENFYTLLTATGKAKLANSATLGTKINFKTLKVGDGNGNYYEPTENQESLVHQVWSGNISSITVDETNTNWIITETIIPATEGGFFIREAGIFDEDGALIAISKLAATYKPIVSEGSTKDLSIKIILEVSNSSSVTLKIDPTVILATKADINTLTSSVNSIKSEVENSRGSYANLKERLDHGDTQLSEMEQQKANTNQVTILPSSNIVACVGDSITNAAGASAGRGYAQILRFVAGTRNVDQVYRIYATGGYTSSQILAEHIPNACAGDASVIHVAWGTNDGGTGDGLANFISNTIEAHRQITAVRKKMTISLIPPRGSLASVQWRKDRASYNEWISRWASLNNIPVADTSNLIDPTTGHLDSLCDSGDGTHPNDLGHARLAVAVAKAVLKALPVQPHRQIKAPDINLISNGTIGTSPASGIQASWGEVTGGTGIAPIYSAVADTNGVLNEGVWLQMDWDATTGGTRIIRAGGLTKETGWTTGDQLEMCCTLEFEDISGFKKALEKGTATFDYVMFATDNTTVQGTGIPKLRTPPIGKCAIRFTAPNTTYPSPALRITLPDGVHVKIRIGEVAVYNLTTLGLTRSIIGS